jgi:Asp-tRNA(Asn)/Glu-tRNA(Gln) amidotransferase B subunit
LADGKNHSLNFFLRVIQNIVDINLSYIRTYFFGFIFTNKIESKMFQSTEKYEPVIGLEIDVPLSIHSKTFSPDLSNFANVSYASLCFFSIAPSGSSPELNAKFMTVSMQPVFPVQAKIAGKLSLSCIRNFCPCQNKYHQVSLDNNPVYMENKIEIIHENKQVRKNKNASIHIEEVAGKSSLEQVTELNSADLGHLNSHLPVINSKSESQSTAMKST